ncbi:hypothetical protein HOLleu_24774 [Holothuria leucospilota]|uniref:Uncharacterized protein n=1 Tax=Holothuria leucospilota TaxID=206669 RepID=A0A9Q1BR57_HOLLE|nr:hypothetical protein HOLleu_24774 [Holothuria leucospilota]
MSFNLDRFVASASMEKLNSLKKSEIVKIAKKFGIEFQSTMRKDEINRRLAEHLEDENILPGSELEAVITVPTDRLFEIKRFEVEIQRELRLKEIKGLKAKFCKKCSTCQMVGKSNQNFPVAPLKPTPAFNDPCRRVIIDCVGPLPKSKVGHQYILTIMYTSKRFPEAIPLRYIKTHTILQALFFSHCLGYLKRSNLIKDPTSCQQCFNRCCMN